MEPQDEAVHLRRRGDIYILDLKQSLVGMDQAYTFVSNVAKNGGSVLFVGTKKQAQEAVADAPTVAACPTSTPVGSAACSPTS